MMNYSFDSIYPRYEQYSPRVPVWCITPDIDGAFHRFFDTSPISPSGRYAALTRMLKEDRLPKPGDIAEIILIDLETGENRVIAETCGWDTQLGAQVQWGKDDTQLFFNDLDLETWNAYGIVMDPVRGKKRKLEGTVYMVSSDGRYAISPCLLRTGATQAGYGVIVPQEYVPVNRDITEEDGIYITDVETGKARLLVSFKDIVRKALPPINMEQYGKGAFYGFHVKWNPRNDRIMFVIRYTRDRLKFIPQLVTMKADATDIRVAIPASEWSKGGHHPNWLPDGENLLINIKYDGKMRLAKARYDGSNYGLLINGVIGSGHPTLHPNGKIAITDSYVKEEVAFGDGTTPIRLMRVKEGTVENILRIRTEPAYSGPKVELRVDPHPAWDRSFKYIVFNACPEGKRKVFIADMKEYLD